MTRTARRSTDKGMGIAPRTSSSRREFDLLACGIVAGPLFFAISSIAGALRPGYDPLRHPVSSLEFGPQGWMQAVNLLLTGTLVVFFGWVSGRQSAGWAAGRPSRSSSSSWGSACSVRVCSTRTR
jgi:hypothetical protein